MRPDGADGIHRALGYVVLEALQDLGRWDEMLAGATNTSAMGREQGAAYHSLLCDALRLRVLSLRSDLGEAAAIAERMLPEALEMAESDAALQALDAAAALALARGDLTTARDLAAQVADGLGDQAPRIWGRCLPNLARVAAATGDVAFLQRLTTIAKPAFPRERNALRTVLAMSRETAGDLTGAREVFLEAADGWARFSIEEQARALLGAGRCGLRLGEPGASDQMREARRAFLALGAVALAAEAG